MSKCYIFAAGEHFEPPSALGPQDFVIAADGGYAYAEQHGITPNLLVGDFDSLPMPPSGRADMVVLPREKDDTDMIAALQEGWQRGFRAFHIYGGTGGRLDHTLANIQCLADLAGRGARGYLYGKDTVITAIKNSGISFTSGCTGVVSVFAHSDIATGVSETGFKYPLTDTTLYNTYPLGISNEFTGTPSSIVVRTGTLIVIYPRVVQEECT